MILFYSTLRWEIKDLEDKLKKAEESAKHWREAYDGRRYDTWGYESKIKEYESMFKTFGEKVNALSEDNEHLQEENELLKHDLDMAGQQFESANEEIKRLQAENLLLISEVEKLRARRGCPCDKRGKH